MIKDDNLDRTRADVEERQKSILWEDARKGGRSVDEFLWKGTPNAKPVQRAGLIVFGLTFLLLGTSLICVFWAKDDWGGKVAGSLLGGAMIIASIRFLRNAFLRSAKSDRPRKDD